MLQIRLATVFLDGLAYTVKMPQPDVIIRNLVERSVTVRTGS